MFSQTLQQILDTKLIAIIRGVYGDTLVSLAKAYKEGGISCLEVTLDQTSEDNREKAYAAIAYISKKMGDTMCVGAGTVMNPDQVKKVVAAGASFIISPNTDQEVISETKRLNRISIPGAFTPSEIVKAYKFGADIVKLFPANMLGPDYIKSIKAPLKHIPILATGGVTPENIGDYLKAGSTAVGVAGELVKKVWIQEGSFSNITKTAIAYLDAIEQFKKINNTEVLENNGGK